MISFHLLSIINDKKMDISFRKGKLSDYFCNDFINVVSIPYKVDDLKLSLTKYITIVKVKNNDSL